MERLAPVTDEVEAEAKKKTELPAKEGADGDGAETAAGKDDTEADAETGNDDDKDLIEDTSDLGRDYDDMSEVKEHIDGGVEDKN